MSDTQAIVIAPVEPLVLVHYEDHPLIYLGGASSAEPVQLVVVSSGGLQGAGAPPEPPKSVTIPFPEIGDNFTLYRTDANTVFSSIIGTVQGSGSPEVTVSLTYGSDRNNTLIDLVSSTTITNSSSGQGLPLSNQPIPSDNYIVLNITGVSGTVTELNLAFRTAP